MKNNKSQKNILNGWRFLSLGEFAKTSSGGTPKSTESKYYLNGTIPWLNSGEVRKGKISTFDNYITKEGLKNSSAKLFPKNTVLVAMYGATAGQVGILKNEASTNQAICGIIPSEEYSSMFLYYFFKRRTSQLLQMGAGAAQPNISQDILRSFDILLPPLPEQKRIVAVLEVWDEAVEKLARKIEIKKNIKKGLMQNFLTGKVRLEGFDEKWQMVKLQDVAKVIMGQSPSSSAYNENKNGLPLIQGNNDIKKGKTIERIWTTEITKTVDYGTIIMTVRAPVGSIGIASGEICMGRGVCGIVAEKINKDFLLKFLEKCESTWRSLEQGSTFSSISGADIRNLEMNIPVSNKEQKAIAGILTVADEEIEKLEKKLEILKEQKKYLLNNLVTGQIRTPENLKV